MTTKRYWSMWICSVMMFLFAGTLSAQEQEHTHKFDNGFCTCGEYEPAVLDAMSATYLIGNAGQLYWFAELVNTATTPEGEEEAIVNAKLTTNIVVNKDVLVAGTLNTDCIETFKVWTPIGTGTTGSTVNFDGQGHTISGLYFNDTTKDNIGLFAACKGTVQKVGVTGSYLAGKDYVGGICGNSTGNITNCYSLSIVAGTNYCGGVCGRSAGTVSGCYNAGNVSGTNDFGAVCGLA
ncbi:MAG: hypothetical protein HUK03_10235, partial [Bacteroidaceae bacterium]|nr:hypothetical protein [Bacteroidaceae bacterium]